jgi:hypothetical protein
VSHERIGVVRALDLISARLGFQLQGTKCRYQKLAKPFYHPPDCDDCQALTGGFRAPVLPQTGGCAWIAREDRGSIHAAKLAALDLDDAGSAGPHGDHLSRRSAGSC